MRRRPPHARIIAVYDRLYRLCHGLDRAGSDVPPALRVDVRRSRRALVLGDRTAIRRGDRVGVLHMNNERVIQLHVQALTPMALGLEFRRQLFASLEALAILSRPDGILHDVAAFTAVTILHHGVARAGFEIEKDAVAFAPLVAAYQRALLAVLHPAGRSRLLRLAAARSERLWISRERLLALYLAPGRTPHLPAPPSGNTIPRPTLSAGCSAAIR